MNMMNESSGGLPAYSPGRNVYGPWNAEKLKRNVEL